MAAREHEEEQTQRTMLALNTLQYSYPGKEQTEVIKIISEVHGTALTYYCCNTLIDGI